MHIFLPNKICWGSKLHPGKKEGWKEGRMRIKKTWSHSSQCTDQFLLFCDLPAIDTQSSKVTLQIMHSSSKYIFQLICWINPIFLSSVMSPGKQQHWPGLGWFQKYLRSQVSFEGRLLANPRWRTDYEVKKLFQKTEIENNFCVVVGKKTNIKLQGQVKKQRVQGLQKKMYWCREY